MLAGMQRAGQDVAPLLAEVGVDIADPASRIPLDRYAALYTRLSLTLDDEGFGLFSQPMRGGSFEFLCRACLGAGNLGEALERAARFLRLVLPDMAVALVRSGERAELHLSEAAPHARAGLAHSAAGGGGRVFAFEWLLRLLHALSCWLVGRGLALSSVDFPYARPAHATDYSLIFTEDSRFLPALPGEAGRLVARFQANYLELPIRRDEAALARFLVGAPGKIVMLYRRDREMVGKVRDLLHAALPALPGQEAVAGRLFVSVRSLHRRLAEEGSSFRAIKDALRRDLALARLVKSQDSVARIATDLGYADNSAFYRACLGWTGLSPAAYRRQWGERGAVLLDDEAGE